MGDPIRRPMAVHSPIHGPQPVMIGDAYAPWSVCWVEESRVRPGIFLDCVGGYLSAYTSRSACIALTGPSTRREPRRASKDRRVYVAVIAVAIRGYDKTADEEALRSLQAHLDKGWVPEVATTGN